MIAKHNINLWKEIKWQKKLKLTLKKLKKEELQGIFSKVLDKLKKG